MTTDNMPPLPQELIEDLGPQGIMAVHDYARAYAEQKEKGAELLRAALLTVLNRAEKAEQQTAELRKEIDNLNQECAYWMGETTRLRSELQELKT